MYAVYYTLYFVEVTLLGIQSQYAVHFREPAEFNVLTYPQFLGIVHLEEMYIAMFFGLSLICKNT